MNTVLWLMTGGLLAWLAYDFLHLNLARGMVMSSVIGVSAAYFGGSVLAPWFAKVGPVGDGFSPFALLVAATAAMTCLYATDLVHERYEV